MRKSFFNIIHVVCNEPNLSTLGFVEIPGLTTEDHVTLSLVEHYLDFKVRKKEVIQNLNHLKIILRQTLQYWDLHL